MKISRIVIKNFRAHQLLDVNINDDLCCIIGENNTGKTAILKAIQICMDVSLPGYFRNLAREDIHSSIDISNPSQVLIGIELTGFEGKVNEEALVSTWKTEADRARIFYRFRPRRSVREKIENGDLAAGELSLDDYSWEIKGGGDPAVDLCDMEWNDDGIGESVRFSDLQSYLIVSLPALRDVEAELRNGRTSPLVRLIESFDIDDAERDALIAILETANNAISTSSTISQIANALDDRFKSVAGPAFEMDVTLGLSAATFQAILRNMRLLLSDLALSDFEPARNGLGMNNILYVAILIEYFKKRIERDASSGQLLLIEEPEAHLHPQLQASLVTALNQFEAQVIMTSHSTQITAQVPFASFISLTHRNDSTIGSSTLSDNSVLSADEISDLERYLDATKSNLLFARKVMLVEGPAELFLIPAMIKAVHGLDLERVGISMIAIHGVHFEVYTKLFRAGSLEKKCAIVADADLKPSDASDFDIVLDAPHLDALRGDFVELFLGATTFEREIVCVESLPMLIAATRSLGAPQITQQLENGLNTLRLTIMTETERQQLITDLGGAVLRTAKRFGKARFAQVAARYAGQCTKLPAYIEDALNWLNS
jgi:putative ATP-dependent endonuclease of the OLD family